MNRNHVLALALATLLLGSVAVSYFVTGSPVGMPTPESATRECERVCRSASSELVEVRYEFERGVLVRHECICVPLGVAVDTD